MLTGIFQIDLRSPTILPYVVPLRPTVTKNHTTWQANPPTLPALLDPLL
jgi:hypothetical protein